MNDGFLNATSFDSGQTKCDFSMLEYVIFTATVFIVFILVVAYIFIVRSYRSSKPNNDEGTEIRWGLFSKVNAEDNSLDWDNFDIYQGSQGIPSKIFNSRRVGIQPRTYEDLQKSEEQLAESSSSAGTEEAPVKPPKVKFTLKYNTVRSTLAVHVLGVQNVPKRGKGDVAYYVTLRIFPQPHRTFHTRAIESGNPLQFNELFEFDILEPSLLVQSLKLMLSYFDRFSHHDVIGDLMVELAEVEPRGLTLSREILLCKELSKKTAEISSNGDIMLSLGYLRLIERLAVVIISAKNLHLPDTDRTPDPYVEVALLHGRRTIKHKKTSSKIKDCNPVFNESLTFHIPYGILHQSSLLISVKNDAGVTSNDVILGQVLLGPDASGIQFEHWNEMRVNNKPIARWHKLHLE